MKTTSRIWAYLKGYDMTTVPTEPTLQQKQVFGANVKLDAKGNPIETGIGALKTQIKAELAKAEVALVAAVDAHTAAAAPAVAVPPAPVAAVTPAAATPTPAPAVAAPVPAPASPAPAASVAAPVGPTVVVAATSAPAAPVVAEVAPAPAPAPAPVPATPAPAPVVAKTSEKDALLAKLKALEAELAGL